MRYHREINQQQGWPVVRTLNVVISHPLPALFTDPAWLVHAQGSEHRCGHPFDRIIQLFLDNRRELKRSLLHSGSQSEEQLGWAQGVDKRTVNHVHQITWKASRNSLLDPTSRGSDSLVLGWSLRICIAIKFLGDVDAPGSGTLLWKHLCRGWPRGG